MYIRFYKLLLLLFITTAVSAQESIRSGVPQMFSYSSQLRDANQNLVISRPINLRFTIHNGSLTGPAVYTEIISTVTSPAGIFTVVIGGGSIDGVLDTIPWQDGDMFLEVEVDPSGGTNFVSMGTNQLLSFPYAITAGNGISSIRYDSTGVMVINTTDARSTSSVGSSWLTNGNAASANANPFIGTTDNTDLILKRMNVEGLRLKANNVVSIPGKLGLGTASASPATTLDVDGGVTLRDTTVNVSGNFTLNVGNQSLIFINSTAAPGSADLTMANGLQKGQIVILAITGTTGKGISIFNQGTTHNTRISIDGKGVGTRVGDSLNYTEGNTITLLWNGTDWVQLSSSIPKP